MYSVSAIDSKPSLTASPVRTDSFSLANRAVYTDEDFLPDMQGVSEYSCLSFLHLNAETSFILPLIVAIVKM